MTPVPQERDLRQDPRTDDLPDQGIRDQDIRDQQIREQDLREEDRPGRDLRGADGGVEVTRSEEELVVGRVAREAGSIRLRKEITTEHVEQTVDRGIEHADVERMPPLEDDDGEVLTYDDGSVSVPVLEEELVVTRRVVVRERILIRKHTEVEPTTLRADLRGEEVSVDTDDAIADRVHHSGTPSA